MKLILQCTLIVGAGIIGYSLALVNNPKAFLSPSYWEGMGEMSEVLRLVNSEYVNEDSVGFDQLTEAAISGMMAALDDHSEYLNKERFKRFEEETMQRYVGVGIEIEKIDGRITVITAFEGGPAFKAGMQSGDQIIEVDGKDTKNASMRGIVGLLRGKAYTRVDVTIFRPGEDKEVKMSVKRRYVDIDSIREVEMRPDGIGYIRITQFGDRTAEEFADALDDFEKQAMKGLIIDLRDNPGGLLRASVALAGEFFEKGEVVVYTKGRVPEESREYTSKSRRRKGEYPIAILINHNSASASEVVSGALQDIGRATLVGETTYGKGSVQSIYALGNGSGLRQTTAHYFTPKGRIIDKIGLAPDIEINITDDERFKLRLQRRQLTFLSPEAFEEKFQTTIIEDRQMNAAVAFVLSKVNAPKDDETDEAKGD